MAPEESAPKEETSRKGSEPWKEDIAGKAAFLRLKWPIEVKATSGVAVAEAEIKAAAKVWYFISWMCG